MGSIPTEADWRSEPWSIDVPCAYEHFAGKSLAEAIALFEKAALLDQEDDVFMPAACFGFYVKAYIDYLRSDRSKGDADGAGCFYGVVRARHKETRSDRSLTATTADLLRHLAARQEWYDADASIYGSFAERSDAALRLLDA